MIDLLELLHNQYFSSPKLYVTWDTASWHKSAMLVQWLDAFNSTTRLAGEGPLIAVSGCDRGCVQRDEARSYPSFQLS